MSQTIVYVMRHIDIGGHIEIPYKKVGITGAGQATLSSRLQQISSTKSPIKAQCIAAWRHDDAKAVEYAIHMLLDDIRIEGEWFLDKEDSLVERLQPLMELLDATEVEIEGSNDSYTNSFIAGENDKNNQISQAMIGEVSGLLKTPLRSSIRKRGPTFFSDKTNLTYYLNRRITKSHDLEIGRSKDRYDHLLQRLESQDLDIEQHPRGHMMILGINTVKISEIINFIESEYREGTL